ncbi:high mobility group B protein 14 [Punica granatum]|uniref:High mobility group B protein 14 n=1 Tax=Punica granatum TaxID=22663 RepID=A0A6P8CY63_PUNGR|nr:high mobility group B protein 14 [Punica granatum]
MAKKASKSQDSAPPPSSSRTPAPSAGASEAANAERMVLRAKSSEKMKRLAEMSRESEDERRPKSAKTSKGSLNKKKNHKLDSKKPKKPPTAFFYFLEDFRKEYQEQNPDIKSMRDIGKACGAKWKTMTYEEKVQYYDIAAEKRREFDQVMAEYIKRKESGEDPESEDETESDK